MHKLDFDGRIVVLGFGSVSRCSVPLLLRHLNIPHDRISIVDMIDYAADVAAMVGDRVRFHHMKITEEGFARQLASLLSPGDLLIDLAWNIETAKLLDWCRQCNVRYLNTSVELWDPYTGAESRPTVDRTLYVRHMAIRQMVNRWGNSRSPTAILEHGANPGLVSHFTKVGLRDIANRIIAEKPRDPRVPPLRDALANFSWNRVAQLVGLKVIHISERDTQIGRRPRSSAEFVNTWSVEGFYEEAIAPAEMGWGTHEYELPSDARLHHSGPRHQICLARYGMNTRVRSRVPSGEIVGMVIRHGEAFSISEHLTLLGGDGTPVYRPTVHYAYLPCDAAIASLQELRNRNYSLQESAHIMSDEITSGHDELGCLLMGHDFKSWWTGSILGIEEARQLVPGQNATTVQVACSVLASVFYMIRHPNEGVLLPDQLPFEQIMEVAKPYLGQFVSRAIDWAPGAGRDKSPSTSGRLSSAESDPWQFSRFLVV
jgi:homospermidine synthase